MWGCVMRKGESVAEVAVGVWWVCMVGGEVSGGAPCDRMDRWGKPASTAVVCGDGDTPLQNARSAPRNQGSGYMLESLREILWV